MPIDKQYKAKTVSKEKEAEQPLIIHLPASVATNKVDEYNAQALQQMFATALNPIQLQSVTIKGLALLLENLILRNVLSQMVLLWSSFLHVE